MQECLRGWAGFEDIATGVPPRWKRGSMGNIKFCSIYFKSIRVHHASAIINLEVISGSRSIILPAIERGVRRPPRPSS